MEGVNDELRAELLARADRDQAAWGSLPAEPDMEQWERLVEPVDRANTARLREIVAEHGWPGHRLVGEEAAHAAWLLAQHAPPQFQEQCLPLLEDAVALMPPGGRAGRDQEDERPGAAGQASDGQGPGTLPIRRSV
jgi:hypothetical protein